MSENNLGLFDDHDPDEDDYQPTPEEIACTAVRWTQIMVDTLLDLYFKGRAKQTIADEIGVSSENNAQYTKTWKLAINHDAYNPVNRIDRSGEIWTRRDLWALKSAKYTKSENGRVATPETLAKVLGRPFKEVDDRWHGRHHKKPSFYD